MTPLTIGITTRNRPVALRRCLESITRVLGGSAALPRLPGSRAPGPPDIEVLVFDDNSDAPVPEQLAGALPANARVIRDERGVGYIAGRNALVRSARHELVLLLDDDAVMLQAGAIEKAVTVVEGEPAWTSARARLEDADLVVDLFVNGARAR